MTRELEHLARSPTVRKLTRRDIPIAIAEGADGATTVSATMYIAHAAGIRVFATGGIGGVHRGDHTDVSADLPELARTPMVVVCAGAKAILDLPATLEWLETHGVPVLGWGTNEFPAFFTRESGLPLETRVDDARAGRRHRGGRVAQWPHERGAGDGARPGRRGHVRGRFGGGDRRRAPRRPSRREFAERRPRRSCSARSRRRAAARVSSRTSPCWSRTPQSRPGSRSPWHSAARDAATRCASRPR